MVLLGERIREERLRLGLTQDQLGVAPKTQRFYESGERSPDAEYLRRFAEAGADILYIVTGRAGGVLAPDESALLAGYRAMDDRGRAMVLAMIGGYTHPAAPSLKISGATIGQVVQGDAAGGGQVMSSPEAGASKKRL
jgi:transcriptional regulator with XRE-family HTH domain